MEIGRIKKKQIRVEIGDVYLRKDNWGDTVDFFEVIDINAISKAITIYQERYNSETILPFQKFVDRITLPMCNKVGKMVEEKSLFGLIKKKVFKKIYEG